MEHTNNYLCHPMAERQPICVGSGKPQVREMLELEIYHVYMKSVVFQIVQFDCAFVHSS